MKTRYKLLIESYNKKGTIAFLFNSLQSVLSDFLFGMLYFFLFDYLKKDTKYQIYGIIFIILIFIYFIFFIPLWGFLMEKCESIYRVNLEKYLFEKKLNLKLNNNEHSSVFLTLLQHDSYIASKIAGWNLVVFFQAIISGVISSFIIGFISLKILLLLYLLTIIAITVDIFCSKIVEKIIFNNRNLIENRFENLIDFINNILIIKIYNQEKNLKNKIDNISDEITNNSNKINVLENISTLINNTIYLVGFKVIVIFFGLNLIVKNQMTFGELLLIFSMINGIIFVAEYMGKYIKTLKKINISCRKIDDFLEKYDENNFSKTEKFENIKKIEFKNINFQYNENEKIFNNLNLIFNFPNNYIILGENGSGKSTLLKLIFNLNYPNSGEIYINDKKLDNNSNKQFPFGFVPQQVSIFNGTILENLKMERDFITEMDLKKVIETVELNNWINNLENGLETEINEKGKNISKGEKMRLAIGRELLKTKEILFLDEPDANIDLDTVERIFENIRKNYPHLNLVVITHLSKREMYKNFEIIEI